MHVTANAGFENGIYSIEAHAQGKYRKAHMVLLQWTNKNIDDTIL